MCTSPWPPHAWGGVGWGGGVFWPWDAHPRLGLVQARPRAQLASGTQLACCHHACLHARMHVAHSSAQGASMHLGTGHSRAPAGPLPPASLPTAPAPCVPLLQGCRRMWRTRSCARCSKRRPKQGWQLRRKVGGRAHARPASRAHLALTQHAVLCTVAPPSCLPCSLRLQRNQPLAALHCSRRLFLPRLTPPCHCSSPLRCRCRHTWLGCLISYDRCTKKATHGARGRTAATALTHWWYRRQQAAAPQPLTSTGP